MTKQKQMPELLGVGFIGSYMPRRCGIATFTHDIATSVAGLMGQPLGQGDKVQIVALNNVLEGYPYPQQVRFEIRDRFRDDYREAAEFLNVAPINVISLQHEFGILGGEDISCILALLGNLKKPVVSTLHTVLEKPNPRLKLGMQKVCELSTKVIVMAERARKMLVDIYGVEKDKIRFVHHGVPDVPFADSSFYKDQFHVEGRPVALTFGLLSPNKGIEHGIDAIAEVAKKYPDIAYIVLGATHPEIKKERGEEYRVSLERRVKKHGLTENVIFHNRYVSLEQLCEFLLATDIYITPYLTKEQIVSGTLAYAAGCGKAIVSTPYWYAEEILADGRGHIVPFGKAGEMGKKITELLDDDLKRNQMRKKAYLLGREMIWDVVGQTYIDIFKEAMDTFATIAPHFNLRKRIVPKPSIPEVNLKHLRTMTDDTGMLQHAVYGTPDRRHGYCVDDNTRALVVVAQNWRLFKDESVLPLFQTYLSFMHYAFNEEAGRFRNFMNYERQWMEAVGSPDSHGRALWGLGAAVAFAPNEPALGLATRLFIQAMPAVEQLDIPRTNAFALIGIHEYLRRFSGASDARRMRELLAKRLYRSFQSHGTPDWPWCEDILTYCNAKLPHALILAGRWMQNDKMLIQGLKSLDWLFEIQTDSRDGHLTIIGNEGWYKKGGTPAKTDQQCIDVEALIAAAREAFLVTGEQKWHDRMIKGISWFLGSNDVNEPLYDFTTGGCRDGLHHSSSNQNQGAESTLAWLMALHNIYTIEQNTAVIRKGTTGEVENEEELAKMINDPGATELTGSGAGKK